MKIFRFTCSLFAWCFLSTTFAADIPFSDVKTTDPFYEGVLNLYEAKIISDDGSHLFHPNEPMNRDFFVSLATQIGCKECMTPDIEDILQFQSSPFIDLKKENPYYYCVSYAEKEKITNGYILDNTGKTRCENWEEFSSSPFCGQNSITRIEAAAMLLRRANLWNDILNNGNFSREENISDVTPYWYGYAKKAISIGILTKKSDNSIGQNEKITRGEFAIMAAKILEYTQCNTKNDINNSSASYIEIQDKNKNPATKTDFNEWEDFIFIPRGEPGNWQYEWTFTNGNSEKKFNTPSVNGNSLPPGKWFVDLKIIDPNTKKIISNPNITVFIHPKNNDTDGDGIDNNEDKCPTVAGPWENNWCPNNPENNDTDGDGIDNNEDKCPTVAGPRENNWCPYSQEKIGVFLISNPSVTHIWNPISFTPIISHNNGDLDYNWDFGDGNRNYTGGNKTHSYNNPGAYPVTLRITNKITGETAQSRIIIRITNNRDSDGDGILDDNDHCPLVRWIPENNGCPKISLHDYGCSLREIYSGNWDCNHQSLSFKDHDGDDDNDGIKNSNDKCPKIPGTPENNGCPNNFNDTDGDGISDSQDKCPLISWLPEWNGCPHPDLYHNISQNICLAQKMENQGMIIGAPVCNACPCANSVNITSQIRDCDVIFPTILSPEKTTIYSRGNFYLFQ